MRVDEREKMVRDWGLMEKHERKALSESKKTEEMRTRALIRGDEKHQSSDDQLWVGAATGLPWIIKTYIPSNKRSD